MLNRRLLRVKVFQSLYAFFQSDDADVVKSEKNLMLSIDRVYELYLHFLLLPVELASIAENLMEEAKQKALPSDEDINPNRKFVDNFLIHSLNHNQGLKDKVKKHNVSWDTQNELLTRLWKKVKEDTSYKEFLYQENYNIKKFIEKLYLEFILDNEDIYLSFQERSIYWDYEDCDFAIHMAMRYFDKIKSEEQYKTIPELYKDKEEDEAFVRGLFMKSISNDKENTALIEEKTKNWEMDRIAILDVILMKMAITEFLHFPSIPVKVTLNEYIELAKQFSTPKSKLFINGVLDKLLNEFKSENKLKKAGRGLLQ